MVAPWSPLFLRYLWNFQRSPLFSTSLVPWTLLTCIHMPVECGSLSGTQGLWTTSNRSECPSRVPLEKARAPGAVGAEETKSCLLPQGPFNVLLLPKAEVRGILGYTWLLGLCLCSFQRSESNMQEWSGLQEVYNNDSKIICATKEPTVCVRQFGRQKESMPGCLFE